MADTEQARQRCQREKVGKPGGGGGPGEPGGQGHRASVLRASGTGSMCPGESDPWKTNQQVPPSAALPPTSLRSWWD